MPDVNTFVQLAFKETQVVFVLGEVSAQDQVVHQLQNSFLLGRTQMVQELGLVDYRPGRLDVVMLQQ